MLVSFYARCSTLRQEQEQSIETQILAIRDFAKLNNLTIVKEYKDDGWSGTILARPALDELRLDAKNKLWEAVIIYDPDRVARRYAYQSLVIEELEEIGIKVLFVTTPPAKNDEDKLLYGVKGLFAEYERTRIADRFRLGKLRKAREGNIVTTDAPYGYTYILKHGQKHGYYEVNPAEAEVVKMIFSLIGEQGFTIRKVIRKLQELNIPPRKSKRRVWANSTLVTLLRNETYIGKGHYLKSYGIVPENPHTQEKYKKIRKTSRKMRPHEDWITIPTPRIIDDALFERTREQLKLNFELCQRNRKNDYLLSGRIYCICGDRRAGEGAQRGKHLYYRCTNRVQRYPLPPICLEGGINARIADKIVWEAMSKLMSSPKLMKAQAERWLEKKSNKAIHADESIQSLENVLEKLKKEEQRYLKAYGAELITFEKLQGFIGDVKSKQKSIQGQISNLSEKTLITASTMPSKEHLEAFTQKALEVLPALGFDIRQAIVRKSVDKVVANQQEMNIYGHLPIGKENNYVKFWSISRNSRITKRGEVDVI